MSHKCHVCKKLIINEYPWAGVVDDNIVYYHIGCLKEAEE